MHKLVNLLKMHVIIPRVMWFCPNKLLMQELSLCIGENLNGDFCLFVVLANANAKELNVLEVWNNMFLGVLLNVNRKKFK